MTPKEAKQRVVREMDCRRGELVGLARRLFTHPEIGFPVAVPPRGRGFAQAASFPQGEEVRQELGRGGAEA